MSAVSGNPLLGTASVIMAVATTPDGKRLATGEADGSIHLWNLEQSPPLHPMAEMRGHGHAIMALAISADARWLVSGSADRSARLWDLEQRREVDQLPDLGGEVRSVGMDPEAKLAILGAGDGPAWHWSLRESGAARARPFGRLQSIGSVAVSSTGRMVMVGSDAGSTAYIARADALDDGAVLQGHSENISTVAISPDEHWLFAGEADGSGQVWQLDRSGRLTGPVLLAGHEANIAAAAFSPDSQWLLTGSWDETARLWDLRKAKAGRAAAAFVLRGHAGLLTDVAFSADGQFAATSCYDGTVRLWPMKAADPSQRAQVLRGHEGGVSKLAFGAGVLVTAGTVDNGRRWNVSGTDWYRASMRLRAEGDGYADPSVTVSDSPGAATLVRVAGNKLFTGFQGLYAGTVTGARTWDISEMRPPLPFRALELSERLTAADMTQDGRWVATGDSNGAIRVWNTGEGPESQHHDFTPFESDVARLEFAPDARWMVATGSMDSTIQLWHWTAPGQISGPAAIEHKDPLDSPFVRFTRDSRWLVIAGEVDRGEEEPEAVLELWDLTAKTPHASSPRSLRGHTKLVQAATSTRDGRWLFTGSRDGTARRWDLQAADPAQGAITFPCTPTVLGIAVSPDAHWLATGCADKTVRLWDLTAHDPASHPIELRGHNDTASALAFSDDSSLLASGSADNTVRLWDLTTQEPSASAIVLRGHTGDVNELAFTRDGRWLISGSGDNTARVWPLRRADLLASARDIAGRSLSADEWTLYLRNRPFSPTFEQSSAAPEAAALGAAVGPWKPPAPSPGM